MSATAQNYVYEVKNKSVINDLKAHAVSPKMREECKKAAAKYPEKKK